MERVGLPDLRRFKSCRLALVLMILSAAAVCVPLPASAIVGKPLDLPREALPSFNFERDITPILSRFGCNSAGCHGKAEGQNGFKLSVFGYDARADYDAIVREGRGRRVSPAQLDGSLLLQKAAGLMPHGGGVRLAPESAEYQTLRDWVTAGMPFGHPDDPTVDHVTLTPQERVLSTRATEQLKVVAVYTDSRQIDVTRLSQFQSNNESLARVDEAGRVSVGEVPGQAAVMARYAGHVAVFRTLIPRPQPLASFPDLPQYNFIDERVDAQLRKMNVAPSEVADDATFLRRVYLDVIGTLPTPAEVRRFLESRRSDRRARLVDELLERPEYADYWASRWADILRVDRNALGARDAYGLYHWLRESVAANMPADRMARELITADGPLPERRQAGFYKAFKKPGEMSAAVSQVFLGVRIACAECHHHPFDRWGQADYFGMQAFFQNVSFKKGPGGEALVVEGTAEARNPRTKAVAFAHALGEAAPAGAATAAGDQRAILADWLTSAQNPWFTRNLANRMVAHFLGRGLVEPVDDLRDTNPPSNPQLLDALAHHLVDSKFDLKQLIRTIVASRVYQASSRPNESNALDEQNYSRAYFKRQPAEVLLDAVCQATGVPEKFAGVPAGYRAVQLWDSEVPHYFLRLFGRPTRRTPCTCERAGDASIAQVLHLMNAPQIQAKLAHESGRVAALLRQHPKDDGAVAEELYLAFLSRPPTSEERRDAVAYISHAADRRRGTEDLAWSLLNTLEFVFNH